MSFQDPFGAPRSAGLRASDAEREHVADALRRHHADGRLQFDEFEERLERCYQARTADQLDRLLDDLPHGDRGVSLRGAGWAAGRRGRPPLPVLALAAVAGLWLLGALAGALAWGGGAYHHGPSLLPLVVVAFVVWRFVTRRRRRAARIEHGAGAGAGAGAGRM